MKKAERKVTNKARLILVVLFIVLVTTAIEPTKGQVETRYDFKSIQIFVDIVSPTMVHVNRTVSLFVNAGNLSFLDWGLWYAGKTVAVTRAWDSTGNLQFIYPGPASQPDMPALQILFAREVDQGQTYNFNYEYDVTSSQDSLSWSETLDSSQVTIATLSITLKLPEGYYFTGTQPTSAFTGQGQDGRAYASWSGNGFSGQSSVGLSVGFSREPSQASNSLQQILFPFGNNTTFVWVGVIVAGLVGVIVVARRKSLTQKRAGQMRDLTRAYDATVTEAGTFCVNCGNTLPANSEFCGRCGTQQPRREKDW